MSSSDIANLFKQFGGTPAQYQEIARETHARASRERWPLLAAVDPGDASAIPPVQPAADAAAGDSPFASPFAAPPAAPRPETAAAFPQPPVAARPAPLASVSPATAPAPVPVQVPSPPAAFAGAARQPAGPQDATPLQQTFARLARPRPAPAAAPADTGVSFLRRLLRP